MIPSAMSRESEGLPSRREGSGDQEHGAKREWQGRRRDEARGKLPGLSKAAAYLPALSSASKGLLSENDSLRGC